MAIALPAWALLSVLVASKCLGFKTSATQSPGVDGLWPRHKQLVVACNAFPASHPVQVGVKALDGAVPSGGIRRWFHKLHHRHLHDVLVTDLQLVPSEARRQYRERVHKKAEETKVEGAVRMHISIGVSRNEFNSTNISNRTQQFPNSTAMVTGKDERDDEDGADDSQEPDTADADNSNDDAETAVPVSLRGRSAATGSPSNASPVALHVEGPSKRVTPPAAPANHVMSPTSGQSQTVGQTSKSKPRPPLGLRPIRNPAAATPLSKGASAKAERGLRPRKKPAAAMPLSKDASAQASAVKVETAPAADKGKAAQEMQPMALDPFQEVGDELDRLEHDQPLDPRPVEHPSEVYKRKPEHIVAQDKVPSAQEGLNGFGDTVVAATATAGLYTNALWTRSLDYGTCEEYHIDFTQRRLFFVWPGKEPEIEHSCELDMAEHPSVDARNANASQFAVVLTQAKAGASTCVLQAFPLAVNLAWKGKHIIPAELAAVDAFVQPSTLEQAPQSLPELDSSAVLRLEDKIDDHTLASEVLAVRTLDLGHVYAIEPKPLHVILEDFRGVHAFDWSDIEFEAGKTYVGIRLGRGDDPAFPQHLVVYQCLEELPQIKALFGDFKDPSKLNQVNESLEDLE